MDDYPGSNTEGSIQVFNGPEDAVTKGVQFMQDVKNSMDLCYESAAPSIVIEVEAYWKGYAEIRARGGKIRIITEITKENVNYCKKLMGIVDEFRHLDNVKGGIAVSESAYMTTTTLQAAKPLTQVVYSDVLEAVHQQQNFFNSLWERAIPAVQKIKSITNELDSNQNNIFSALDNGIRRSILFNLREEDMKISQLAKKLDITLQAFQKHFTKLVESNLIEKNQSGTLSLTQIGLALTKQIPSIQFLFDNNNFFKTHSLSFIPTKFVQQIGDLQEFEVITDVSKNMERFYGICQDQTKHLKFVNLPLFLDDSNENTSKIIQKDVKIQHIEDVNFNMPNGWIKNVGKEDKLKGITRDVIQKKTAKDSHIVLCVSEKCAGIMFPKLDGEVDFSTLLFSRDIKFIDWCNDLFEHMWQSSELIIEK